MHTHKRLRAHVPTAGFPSSHVATCRGPKDVLSRVLDGSCCRFKLWVFRSALSDSCLFVITFFMFNSVQLFQLLTGFSLSQVRLHAMLCTPQQHHQWHRPLVNHHCTNNSNHLQQCFLRLPTTIEKPPPE